MSHPDVIYVVFCRIDGIKTMASDVVAASVDVLAKVIQAATAKSSPEEALVSHSSVYGRFALVPGRVTLALELAKTILKDSARKGVKLAVGIAGGRVESTQDLLEDNVAGVVVNRAARLAHLPDGNGKIVVEKHAALDAINAMSKYETAFTPEQESQVKKTNLFYRWFSTEPVAPGNLHYKRPSSHTESVHVVVYDIVEFSALNLTGLRLIVGKLRVCVSEALRALGVSDPRQADGRFWYAPAGDGGVIVFRGGSEAWTFATKLREQAVANDLPIRIGIATGQAVVLQGLPVGRGIFEADAISALPPKGDIAASDRFWNETLEASERQGWDSQVIESYPSALLLTPTTRSARTKRNGGTEPKGKSERGRKVKNGHDPLVPEPVVTSKPTGPIDRTTVVRTISGFAPSDMAEVVNSIEGAARHISRQGTVPEQAAELIRWAESSTGPGLEAVQKWLVEFLTSRRASPVPGASSSPKAPPPSRAPARPGAKSTAPRPAREGAGSTRAVEARSGKSRARTGSSDRAGARVNARRKDYQDRIRSPLEKKLESLGRDEGKPQRTLDRVASALEIKNAPRDEVRLQKSIMDHLLDAGDGQAIPRLNKLYLDLCKEPQGQARGLHRGLHRPPPSALLLLGGDRERRTPVGAPEACHHRGSRFLDARRGFCHGRPRRRLDMFRAARRRPAGQTCGPGGHAPDR